MTPCRSWVLGRTSLALGRAGTASGNLHRDDPATPLRIAARARGLQCAARKLRAVRSGQRVPGGVVHDLPEDLRSALAANPAALDAWKDITPLARNEFICWVEDAKQQVTRERRIRRTQEELQDGQRRPCCWPGCSHRERTGK